MLVLSSLPPFPFLLSLGPECMDGTVYIQRGLSPQLKVSRNSFIDMPRGVSSK